MEGTVRIREAPKQGKSWKFRGQKEGEMEGDMRAIIASYALMGRRPEMSRSFLLGHRGYLPHGFIIMMPEV